jgi:hypothetical protein
LFLPGVSKSDIVHTLDYFDVNRTMFLSVPEFVQQYEAGTIDRLWNSRSRVPGAPFAYAISNEDNYRRIQAGELNEKDNYFVESMRDNDRDNLVCNGEAMIYKDSEDSPRFGAYHYSGFVNKMPGLNMRTALSSPDTLWIKNRHQVPKPIFNMMWEKGIIGYVMEFTIFKVPVGVKNQKIVIWEIRKY